MAKHFILDGYNIIKSGFLDIFENRTLEEQRHILLDILKTSNIKNVVFTVVFDGRFSIPFFNDNYKVSDNIKVVFSRGGTADEKIVNILGNRKYTKEVCVVSDDKGLRRLLGGSGVSFTSVREFYNILFKKTRKYKINKEEIDSIEEDLSNITAELKKRWCR